MGSKTLTAHLVRGAIGFASLWLAIHLADTHVAASVSLGVVMLLAFRGCPLCWTLGPVDSLKK